MSSSNRKIPIKNPKLLISSIAICQLIGFTSSFFTVNAISNWYKYLNKPLFNPPNWVFGPVWTTLYALMGISLYLVWIKGSKNPQNNWALRIFGIQLILNFFWSIIFFGLKLPGAAFVEIIILWGSIIYTIKLFSAISRWSAYLLYPYILWVTFAGVLNFYIWYLN